MSSSSPPPEAGPGPDTAIPRATLATLIDEDPLVHPFVASLALFDYEQPPPDHLREIYGAVYRGLRGAPQYPTAPKYISRFFPREHGKSEAGSVVVPTWAALDNPNIRVLIMSETEGQAKGKLRECRDHIRALGPRFNREIVEDNKTELTLARSETFDVPTIKAAGFNTGITGGHFDLIIFDDIVSWESQRTEQRREKMWSQFRDYLHLGSQSDSVFLVLGTRKHPDDLYSNLIEGSGWDSQVRPAIADWSIVENADYDVLTDTGSRYGATEIQYIDPTVETIVGVDPHREVDVLWPERWPLDDLLLDMIAGFGGDQGTLIWRREMMNDAAALQGQILSAEMLQFTDGLPRPPEHYTWYGGLDPAVEDDPERAAAKDTDYWALAVIAYDRANDLTYLVDVERRRGMSITQGLSWATGILKRYRDPGIRTCLVEDAQAQRWFVQTGKDEGLPLERSRSSGKKEDRIIGMSPRFESGKVQIVHDGPGDPESSAKWQSFADEWAAFPAAAHDDRLDATEIALRNVETAKPRKRAGVWGR